jgi:protein TonB
MSVTVKNTMPLLITLISLIGLSLAPANAQRTYLDAVLEPSSKGQAAYYLEQGGSDGTGGYLAQIFSMDDVLKAKGRYADPEYRVPDGHFVFYFPNGQVESEGNYEKGRKNGVWTRNDKWGRELAEKVYDAAPLKNLVYTLAQTMPQYPGGDKALVRYVRDKVGKTSGGVMASFIVEKDGQLSDLQVVGADDPRIADQIAAAISTAPRWEAGVQDGQPVRVQMRVPLK